MTGERCGGPADLVADPASRHQHGGVLLRLLYLTLTNMFTLIRLLPRNEHDKDAEILALHHQLTVLQRQTDKPKLAWPDRALLAALLRPLPRIHLRQLPLIVTPDTVLRWHRDLLRRRH